MLNMVVEMVIVMILVWDMMMRMTIIMTMVVMMVVMMMNSVTILARRIPYPRWLCPIPFQCSYHGLLLGR